MSLKYQSQLLVDYIPDPQIENQFEVLMPSLSLTGDNLKQDNSGFTGFFRNIGITSYSPIVEEIVFKPRNFKTATRRVRTGWCNVAEDIENYGDVIITMYCSSGMLTQYYLEEWKRMVFDPNGEYYNPMQYYKRNIEVYFMGPGNIGVAVPKAAHFTLAGCFPYLQEDYKLAYKDNPQRLRITQRFKVDKVIIDQDLAKANIATELLTSPTSLVGNVLASPYLFGDQNTYDAHKIYE